MKPKQIAFNFPQYLLFSGPAPNKCAIMGRGIGKSTSIAFRMQQLAYQMPQAKFVLSGSTYMQMLTETLPSTIHGLAMLGYHKDIHYLVGRRNKAWEEPFQPPLEYTHCIHWHNGTVFQLVTQDRDVGRGLNIDGVIGDEIQKQDPEMLDNNVLKGNRANQKRFKNCPLHYSQFYVGTQPRFEKQKWVFKFEQLHIENPTKWYFLEANSFWNKHNLPPDYFNDIRRTTSNADWKAEIMNERQGKIEGAFYSQLTPERHYSKPDFRNDIIDLFGFNLTINDVTCRFDNDIQKQQKLILGIDWGAHLNSMIVAQEIPDGLRCLKNLYVNDKIIDDLIKKFIKYYAPHTCKEIDLYYDRNGNNAQANSGKTYAEQAIELLQNAGWKVTPKTFGLDMHHNLKHLLLNRILEEDSEFISKGYPKIRINQVNCSELIISMENAPAKDKDGKIVKDKSSEDPRRKTPQEHATHLSDAFDVLVCGRYKYLIKPEEEFREIKIMTLGQSGKSSRRSIRS